LSTKDANEPLSEKSKMEGEKKRRKQDYAASYQPNSICPARNRNNK
jgi:hypothetical protein